jgi:hypothetical protein
VTYRVVVYAEGRAEDAGLGPSTTAPREDLPESELGTAHILTRRVIADLSRVPEAAIRFVSPLRLGTGRRHAGGDLLKKKLLRQLLTWPTRPPHFAIVLVDEDGESSRRRALTEATEGLPLPRVIGVAVREFEAWLVADVRAVREVIAPAIEVPAAPESLDPGRAKELLQNWISAAGAKEITLRMQLAARSDLGMLSRLGAFREFAWDVGRMVAATT